MAGKTTTLAAQVFLRSASGRSIRELGAAPLPADLSPYMPTQAGRRAGREAFEGLGFKVFEDAMGVTMSIEGPPALFTRAFGIPRATLRGLKALKASPAVRLDPPEAVRDLVEEIVLIPPPEWFG
jgi:hypothetical protein